MNNSQNHTPEVKKGLISLLMFSIYSEQRTIYREYVQNALDSINKAVEDHILNANKDGKVEITIDSKNKKVTIKDNGTGIKSQDAIKVLLDISSSTKDGITQAGQFGIGRLVGGGYCHNLIFRTSARGEEIGTKVIFDVDKIWQMVKEDKEDYLASYVISQCTSTEPFSCSANEHFFEVILDGIKEESAPTLLDKNKVIDYLTEVAPVEYTSSFNNALIYSSLNAQPEFKSLFDQLDKVQIFVNSKRIQKQYGLTVKGTKDKIYNLEFFKIEDETFGMLAWGWFALTKFSIQIPKSDSLACIRLRKHNIQIGGFNQLSGSTYWKEERSNAYFYGELFVSHPNIMPNAARDGLAPTPETIALNKLLKEYFENLKSLYTKANAAKKCVDKMNEGFNRIKKNGAPDYNSKDLIDNKGLAAFNRLIKNSAFGPTQRMLMLYQPEIDETKSNIDKLLNQLKSKKTSPTRSSTSYENTSTNTTTTSSTNQPSSNYPSISDSSDNTNLNPNEPNVGQVNESSTAIDYSSHNHSHPAVLPFNESSFNPLGEGTQLVPTTTTLLGGNDIVSKLEGVMEPNEVFLVRRIFRVLNTFCPNNEQDQSLVRNLQECIVKELSNGK